MSYFPELYQHYLFKYDNNGNLITSYSGREDKLEEIINNVCDKDFDEGLYVYYMYFNGCDGETFEEINISCLVEN